MRYLLGIVYLIVIAAVVFYISALLLRAEKNRSNKTFFACQFSVLLCCVSQVLQLLSHNVTEFWIAYLVGNLGICFIGSAWFYFAEIYTERPIPSLMRYLPLVLSVFHFTMIVTNDLHHLYYQSFSMEAVVHGPLFYTNVFSCYLFVMLGSISLYRHMDKTRTLAKLLVVSSALLPVALNVIYLAGVVRFSFDITPLGFAISIALIMRATIKYKFIDIERELDIATEKLLLEKERNRIAQQVHDTSGHTLTMIQSYLKLAEISAKNEQYEEVADYLSQARTLTAGGIKELRESINMLRQEAEYELVTQGVMLLANQVKEIPVEVTVKGEDNSTYSHLSKVVYDTVRESITNTLKYAGATKIDIIIRFQEKAVDLCIGDDGKGCGNIEENNGLKGIRERIDKAGGSVRFQSAEGEGFLTRVKLPV